MTCDDEVLEAVKVWGSFIFCIFLLPYERRPYIVDIIVQNYTKTISKYTTLCFTVTHAHSQCTDILVGRAPNVVPRGGVLTNPNSSRRVT
jgi:hypothetical protein